MIDMLVAGEAMSRGITRLVHFTPYRTFANILVDGAIRSRSDIDENSPESAAPTDLKRLDGHRDKVCCSIQYPNAFYFRAVVNRQEHRNYQGWVCLLLDPRLLARSGVYFCPVNAAKGNGVHTLPGSAGFSACYDSNVDGRRRARAHLRAAPTDLQAEVLVPGPIPITDLRGIVVDSAEAARDLYVGARLSGVDEQVRRVPWFVAPDMFDGRVLSDAIRRGERVVEEPWSIEETDSR